VAKLRENVRYFREQIVESGSNPCPGETPIVPIIVGETAAAIQMSDMLLEEGVFVTGFGFPVVPQGRRAYAASSVLPIHARIWTRR
jgi:glycine C-acetyltransferase